VRITSTQLRQIICEELERSIDEMAWGGHIGMSGDDPYPNSDYASGEVSSLNDLNGSRSRSEKYAKSAAWASQAMRLYGNLPFTLWTAPYIGSGKDDIDRVGKLDHLGIRPSIIDEENVRVRVLPLAQNLDKIESLGYDTSQVGPNDVVILYTTASVQADFIPSPWMLFHAIFDSEGNYGQGNRELNELMPTLHLMGGGFNSLVPWMTMKSARTSNIFSDTDASAEVMAQELLDRRGFHLAPANKRGKALPKVSQRVVQIVKKVGDEFRANAPGHIFTVVVT